MSARRAKKKAVGQAQKKDTAHSIKLITSVKDLRVNLEAKNSKGARMALVSQQFRARLDLVRAHPVFDSQTAIGDQYRIVAQNSKPLKKTPSNDEDSLSYLTRLVELMITDDVKEAGTPRRAWRRHRQSG